MSSPAKNFKPARFYIIILVLSLAGGAVIGLVGKQLWSGGMSPTMPAPLSAPSASPKPTVQASASLLAPSKNLATSQSEPESVRPTIPTMPTMPMLPVAGNLATITSQRATLAEKKLQKEIDDLDTKLTPTNSAVIFSPDDVAKMLEAPAVKQDTEKPARTTHTTSVVAVQGVDGKLTATLRHNGKLLTLTAGEKFAGGTVALISRQGVSVRGQNGVQSLAFE